MQIVWNETDRAAWDAFHAQALASWRQDWAYGEAMRSLGVTLLRARAVGEDGVTQALAQFTVRRFAGVLTLAVATFGPIWRAGLSGADKRAIYRAMKRTAPAPRPRFVAFTPDEPAGPDAGLNGLSRVMSGYATIYIDLDPPLEAVREALTSKWRSVLTGTERAGLRVEAAGAKPAQYRWLLEREREQQARNGYAALPGGVVEAYQAAKSDRRDGVLVLQVREGRDPIAAMMFVIHGASATYHIGWSSEAGRKANAHTAILWRAIEMLKERGVRRLDLGGLDTADGAGIARFKLGVGREPVRFAGTWV